MNIEQSDFKSFEKNYFSGKKQILYHSLSADIHTPVSILIQLRKEKYAFLFESVEKGSQKGRYSVIGIRPDLIWQCKDNKSYVNDITNSKKLTDKKKPLESLTNFIKSNKFKLPQGLPSISAGVFGYMGYEMIQYFENINLTKIDKLNLPDSIFLRPSITLVFDNVNDKIIITKLVTKNNKINATKMFRLAKNEILEISNIINKPISKKYFSGKKFNKNINIFKNVKTNTSYNEFKAMVEKAKKYIYEGEIFQVVLSRIFKKKINVDPISIYRSLRYLNPSPYLFLMNFKKFSIVGSSPEILIKLEGDKVTVRPIAGTRRRGKDKTEDNKLKNDLLNDPKELSEHLMLLDLGRNDISRVSQSGSVKVTDKMYIEYFSHVMHIVSNIVGKVIKKSKSTDVLFSGFPAGTVTGAPKIRAIEIIEELEKSRRNIYAGSVGYISANGNIDTCIALRTALIKDKNIYVQSGAGIVADSNVRSEFKETENKAMALLAATEYANNFNR